MERPDRHGATHTEGTLTTTTPDGVSTTRPVPPSWATVAPLLARWQMALIPQSPSTYAVWSGWLGTGIRQHVQKGVPCTALPQAIADVAARCAQEDAHGVRSADAVGEERACR